MTLLPPLNPTQVPFLNVKYLQIYSLPVANDATTPNTKISVGTGWCRDSTDVFDIYNSAALTIDTGVVGINGIDTGVLQASKVYYVLLVGDPVSGNTTGAMVSLSATAPVMPSGYAVFRVIGYMVTDSGVHFLKCYNSGDQNARVFTYDAPQSVGTTNASATYADLDLSTLVPLVDNLPVSIAYDFVPNADGDSFQLHGANSTGDAVSIIAPTAAKHVGANTLVLAQTKASKPQISYKTAAAIGSLALKVAGFNYYL